MTLKKKLSEQVALIERVCEEAGLDYNQLAEVVAVTPETMRKLRKGYQAAGEQLLANIRNVPLLPSVRGRRSDQKIATVSTETPAKRPEHPLARRLAYVLQHATTDEQQIVSSVIESAFRVISKRVEFREKSPASTDLNRIVHLPHGFHLRPVLGDIAAGVPQEAIAQADQFLAVPQRYAEKTSYVLRVRGDSMIDKGIFEDDLVYMNVEKEPRNGDVVAALCDHETTLKTFVATGKETPFLRSENKAFPPKIVPADELVIQGVMIGKHPRQ